jgi:hypothetical protein
MIIILTMDPTSWDHCRSPTEDIFTSTSFTSFSVMISVFRV